MGHKSMQLNYFTPAPPGLKQRRLCRSTRNGDAFPPDAFDIHVEVAHLMRAPLGLDLLAIESLRPDVEQLPLATAHASRRDIN